MKENKTITVNKMRKLNTRETLALAAEVQKPGFKVGEVFAKYGALCLGVEAEDFLDLPEDVTEEVIVYLTSRLGLFSN